MQIIAGFVSYLRSALKCLVRVLMPAKGRPVQSDVFGRIGEDEIGRVIEEYLNDRLLRKDLFESMDAETKRICQWQLLVHH
jgi:hypothetical protein